MSAKRSSVEIQKGVPMPQMNTMKGALLAMEAGDSFLVPADWSVSSLRTVAAKFPGMYSVLRVEDGHRCWRLK